VIRACGAAVAIVLIGGAAEVRLPSVARSAKEGRFEFAEPHMGTLVRITLYARDEPEAARASGAAFERIAQLDAALSDYRDDSELTALSRRSGTGPVAVSDDLFRVLQAAQQIAKASDGAFDVTAGPLSVLWRQARRQGRVPDAERLAAARTHVGYDKLTLDATARTATLREAGMQIDLGGIAKGFAADEALKTLRSNGIRRALVAAGGDIAAGAAPPGERGWHVAIGGIEGAAAPGTLLLADRAVSTSGDAEQFVIVGSTRYSHIFDPRTGMALTGRRSVTVIARNGTLSDALATAVSVMGREPGLALIEATPGAAASVIYAAEDGRMQTYRSSRWGLFIRAAERADP
jgi:thiamine biosynthesis lipoprotein